MSTSGSVRQPRWLRRIGVIIALIVMAVLGLIYVFPDTVTQWDIDFERHRAGLTRHELTLANGMHYVYLEGGKGEPLMLLHGFGGDKDNFTRVALHLTPHYHVIIPDQIGFGESSRPVHEIYNALAQADRLHELATAVGARSVHLGGNSMGGQIAIAYAARFPNDVKSLWLLDPAGIWSAPRSELAHLILDKGQNPLIPRTPDDYVKTFEFVCNDPPFIPTPMLKALGRRAIGNIGLAENIFMQTASDSVEERASQVNVPTLIVWGDHDRAIHVETANILHRLMKQSQVRVMAGLGHVPMIEAPYASARDYLAFRQTTGPHTPP